MSAEVDAAFTTATFACLRAMEAQLPGSDLVWLVEQEVARALAAERERIAQAIEALPGFHRDGLARAARIARGDA